ncbi:MAG: DHH family phosphoesterase [Flavobacteriales bacterium]|jgi:bifunctional oligoribonuclease and PAP phosphatase NrnA|nr:DHH family phosphoesterase [Flavobacteriales bacterium]
MQHPSAPAAQVAALAELLRTPRRIALVTHFNPDGDAIGSTTALAAVLKAEGHVAQVVLPNPAARNLHWIPGYSQAINHINSAQQCAEAIASADLLFCLDFNRQDRVEGLEAAVRAHPLKVLIDHHRGPEDFARVAFSDITASSTCQMVHDVVNALGMARSIGPDAANSMYAGLMTDSGSFRFPSTSPHTLRVAADLLERGAKPDAIFAAIMDDNSLERLRLIGFALSEKLEMMPGNEATVIALSKEEHERFHYTPGDTEGLVNYGLGIRGVRLSVFLAERNGIVKLSLRSKGNLPVNEFLGAHFEGGGHANAAGGKSTLPLAEATAKLKAELPAFLAKHPV